MVGEPDDGIGAHARNIASSGIYDAVDGWFLKRRIHRLMLRIYDKKNWQKLLDIGAPAELALIEELKNGAIEHHYRAKGLTVGSRMFSAQLLGKMKSVNAIPALIERLEWCGYDYQSAENALVEIGEPVILPLVEVLGRDGADAAEMYRIQTSHSAAQFLLPVFGQAAIGPLVELASSNGKSNEARGRAIDTLGKMGAAAELVEIFIYNPVGHLRQRAIAALETMPGAAAKELVECWRCGFSETIPNHFADDAIVKMGEASVPHLSKYLSRATKHEMRVSALGLIRRIGHPSAMPVMLALLSDDSDFISKTALEAIQVIADASSVPAILLRLKIEKDSATFRSLTGLAVRWGGVNAVVEFFTQQMRERPAERNRWMSAIAMAQSQADASGANKDRRPNDAIDISDLGLKRTVARGLMQRRPAVQDVVGASKPSRIQAGVV